MRRGLILWSPDEVPPETLEARLDRARTMMDAEGYDALVVHTSVARPAAVSWLTHFVPYWNEAVLVLPRDGGPVLFTALSKRVHGWIREVSRLDDVVSAPQVGRGAADWLARRLATGARLGVVELESLPWALIAPLAEAFGEESVCDSTAAFARIRQPADSAELALARRAAAMARDAWDGAVAARPGRGEALAAAVDGAARGAGAEEVLIRIAPDLDADPRLRRLDQPAPLGARYALEATVAYKGVWVRWGGTAARNGAADAARLDEALAAMTPDALATGAAAPAGVTGWTVEATLLGNPLSLAAMMGRGAVHALPAGALAMLTLRTEGADGRLFASRPIMLGDAAAVPIL